VVSGKGAALPYLPIVSAMREWSDILLVWGDIMEEKSKFNKQKYDTDIKKKLYDITTIQLPKGKLQELKEYAAARDLSVNKLIIRALEEYCMMDLSKKK
jgi:hypothetical protein